MIRPFSRKTSTPKPAGQQRAVHPLLRRLAQPTTAIGALILVVVGGVTAIQFFGDPSAAGPRGFVSLAPSNASAASSAHVPFAQAAEAGADLGEWASADASASLDPTLAEGDAPVDGEVRISMVSSGATSAPPMATAPVRPLSPAPASGLTEPGPTGVLPVVARDGRTSATVYARPFTQTGTVRPRIALIVGGLGFNQAATTQAINELPPEVTLSFVPYAANLQTWIDRARARGHEVMLELPMEPFDTQADDTGPQTLMATGNAQQNIARLENLLSRGAGYFAVTNYQGARFATSAQASQPVVQQLRRRGLAFISTGIGQRTALGVEASRAGLSNTAADRIIDTRREADAIDEQLLNLEALALQNGTAIGAGFAFPVTMVQINDWARQLSSRGYVLAPASAVLHARAAPAAAPAAARR